MLTPHEPLLSVYFICCLIIFLKSWLWNILKEGIERTSLILLISVLWLGFLVKAFIFTISLLISNYYISFYFNQFPKLSMKTEVLVRHSPFANNTRLFAGLGCVTFSDLHFSAFACQDHGCWGFFLSLTKVCVGLLFLSLMIQLLILVSDNV